MYSVYGEINISIIIPTYNAGSQFISLLYLLKMQQNIDNMEIIVVDSGSSDDTVSVARKYGAKVIEITQEEFSHSFARNLGADNSEYDFVLFMTQDALPEDDVWLFHMVKPLLDKEEIVAATCIEEPRKDADLFARMAIRQQQRWLGVENSNRILTMPEITGEENYETVIRKNACLNDVACIYQKEVFLRYKYRFDYAEDLDLGKRLIEDGYKMALLGLTKVIHSHSRSSMYYLRRMVAERVAFAKIIKEYERFELSEEEFISGAIWMYDKLLGWIGEIEMSSVDEKSKNAILEKINSICTSESGFQAVGKLKIAPEKELTKFIDELREYYNQIPIGARNTTGNNVIYSMYREKIDGMIGYLWTRESEDMTLTRMIEICETLYCLYGTVVGTLLGDVVTGNKSLMYLSEVYEKLTKGI